MASPLRITERRIAPGSAGTVTIFELAGGLVYDQGTRMLRDVLTKAVADGARGCVLDLHEITYLDSGGVGSLVSMYHHVARHGGRLKLARPSACATRILGITRLATVFEIFDDEASAARSFD